VTRKISRAVAAIKQGLQKELFLGNLEAKRDWGYAPEYVERCGEFYSWMPVMILSLPLAKRIRSVNSLRRRSHILISIGKIRQTRSALRASAEVDLLIGDASKAKRVLGWEPKVRFKNLVRIMVDADMELLSRETPRQHLGKLP